MMPLDPATLEDVRAEPPSDQEADDTGTAATDRGPDPSSAPPAMLAAPEAEAREHPSDPGVTTSKTLSSDPQSLPKAKKKSKKQAELQAEIRGLEAQIRTLEASPAPGSTSARRRLVVPIVAGLVIVALAAGLVVTALRLRHADTTTSARASAIATAKTYAVDLSSYDYRHLTTDFGVVTAHSTPAFAKTFIQQSDALKPVLTKYKATAKATVDAAGVTSASANHAVVLVLVSQTVSNTVQKKGPTTERSQVSLTLVRQHGHWLIENAQLL